MPHGKNVPRRAAIGDAFRGTFPFMTRPVKCFFRFAADTDRSGAEGGVAASALFALNVDVYFIILNVDGKYECSEFFCSLWASDQ